MHNLKVPEYHFVLKEASLLPRKPIELSGLQIVSEEPRTKGKLGLWNWHGFIFLMMLHTVISIVGSMDGLQCFRV